MGDVREAVNSIVMVVGSMDSGAEESQRSVDHMHGEIEQLGSSMADLKRKFTRALRSQSKRRTPRSEAPKMWLRLKSSFRNIY